MKDYIVTAKAGRRISGIPNPGTGNVIRLTDRQAAHELRMGTIVPADDTEARAAAARKEFMTPDARAGEAAGDGRPEGEVTRKSARRRKPSRRMSEAGGH